MCAQEQGLTHQINELIKTLQDFYRHSRGERGLYEIYGSHPNLQFLFDLSNVLQSIN